MEVGGEVYSLLLGVYYCAFMMPVIALLTGAFLE